MLINHDHPPFTDLEETCSQCGEKGVYKYWFKIYQKYFGKKCLGCYNVTRQKLITKYNWQDELMFDGLSKECLTCHLKYPKNREHWLKQKNAKEGVGSTCKHCTTSKKYGLKSCLERNNFREFQKESCPLCEEERTLPFNGSAHLDHDYKIVPYGAIDSRWKTLSVKVRRSALRGLLCRYHNGMVGHLDTFFADQGLQDRYWAYIKNPPAQAYFKTIE